LTKYRTADSDSADALQNQVMAISWAKGARWGSTDFSVPVAIQMAKRNGLFARPHQLSTYFAYYSHFCSAL
jgi:hypothetical protein